MCPNLEEKLAMNFFSFTLKVCEWLEDIGSAFSQYGQSFVAHGINGEELLASDFGDVELEEIGVYVPMHRRRILKEIKKLQL